MATVSKWTPFGVALYITATGSTVTRISATKYTVVIKASWETYYSGAQTNYGMEASSGGVTKTISAFTGAKRSSGSGSFTGTYSISGNGSATKSITVTFRNFNDLGDSASKSVSFNVTVPAWTSYTVTYSANGGSGAPAKQTKWKDQALTLSSTKPTRSGYTFVGWNTTGSATSAKYAAGGSYTSNANVTLYAIWKKTIELTYDAKGGSGAPTKQSATIYNATTSYTFTIPSEKKPSRDGYTFLGWSTSNTATTASYQSGGKITLSSSDVLYAVWKLNTYTISYDANGGSGAPGSQIKKYGIALTLSPDIPTRQKYDFLGWSTDSTALEPTYQAGGSYTNNAGATLYAIWQLSYVRPRIKNVIAKRCSEAKDIYYSVELNNVTGEYIRHDTVINAPDAGIIVTDAYTADGYQVLYYADDEGESIYYCLVEGSGWIDDELGDHISLDFEYECDRTTSKIVVSWATVNEYASGVTSGGFEITPEEPTTNGVVSRIVDDYEFSVDVSYYITITVEDEFDSNEKRIELPGTKFAIDVLPRNEGISFGGPAELKDTAEFKYKIRPSAGYINVNLPTGTDLNQVIIPNVYSGFTISAYINCPGDAAGTHSFTLTVESAGAAGQLKQTLVTCSEALMKEYTRFYYSGTWHPWAQTFNYAGNLLWDGAYWMIAEQNANLSQPISKQPHGIVLVFCRYVNGVAETHNYNSFFIPKMLVSKEAGRGSAFSMNTVDYTYIATKYLYIHDTTIGGNANNNATGTKNGITYNNAAYVLRYVIGV